jgi:iduronate 2-sulfatase
MKAVLLILLNILLISCIRNKHVESNQFPSEKYNILFISVDDLRPELGCYQSTMVKSPNIDKLASEGFIFERAYCQVPVCGASRASLLTGLLPTPNRFKGYDSRMDEDTRGYVTLPEYFKNKGYYTVNFCKVTHFPDDQEHSWSEAPVRLDWEKLPDGNWSTEGWRDYLTAENIGIAAKHPNDAGLPFEAANVDDTAYVDGKNMKLAVDKLKELKNLNQPFFLAIGLLKPHLPFNSPTRYWELYEDENIKLAPNPFLPHNVPKEGIMNFGELRSYAGIPSKGPVPDSMAYKLIHGYYACISYTDALIGSLLEEMQKLDLIDKTIIVLWGDHGFFLGEHGFWCKHALYEPALHVPLIIKLPGRESGRVNTFVELADLFPTLCEMVNLPIPEHLQGKSFFNAFSDSNYVHRTHVYSRYQNGESIKNDDYRYTEYFNTKVERTANMLYNHRLDPDENMNRASDRKYSEIVNQNRSEIEKYKNQ